MELMLIVVQEQDEKALSSAFIRNKIQATKIHAEGLVSTRNWVFFWSAPTGVRMC